MPEESEKPKDGTSQAIESPDAGPAEDPDKRAANRSKDASEAMSDDVSLESVAGVTSTRPALAEKTRDGDKRVVPPPRLDLTDFYPTPSATVVLMRPMDGVPFEVFLVRRHSQSAFMADAYVYPGGCLDKTDVEPLLANHCRGFLPGEMAERLGLDSEDLARGHYVAAVRETFEEAGALLATEGDGNAIDFQNPDEVERYETYREVLCDEEVDFDQIVGWEDLLLPVDQLVYFAHWITPDLETKRYDTRFFLTRAPIDQRLSHDDKETIGSMWVTPAAALETYWNGGLLLAPPTLMTLLQLARFHSIDEALAHTRSRPVATVSPHATTIDDKLTLLLPGDPEYPKPDQPGVEGPTRLVLSGGRWHPLDTATSDEPAH